VEVQLRGADYRVSRRIAKDSLGLYVYCSWSSQRSYQIIRTLQVITKPKDTIIIEIKPHLVCAMILFRRFPHAQFATHAYTTHIVEVPGSMYDIRRTGQV
jgi:hypothetical protein